MTLVALALFCRPAVPGRTKTRLAPALGEARAAQLYQAFLQDVVATARAVAPASTSLWWSEEAPESLEVPGIEGMPSALQEGAGLGSRMAHCLATLQADASATGCWAAVLGTDAPTLPRAFLQQLVNPQEGALAGADIVLGPSADGGYYVVASRVPMAPVFQGVGWSRASTLMDTVKNARALGLQVGFLPPWYDVDTPADLMLLRTQLALAPELAPATVRFLQGD